MAITCTECGKKFSRPSSWKKSDNPFCSFKCYGEWQKGKKFKDQGKYREKRFCTIAGCTNEHSGKGLCRKHYTQKYYPREVIKKREEEHPKFIKKCQNCEKEFPTNRAESRYCSRLCCAAHQKQPHIMKKGYKKVLIYGHHRADQKGYVFEHIVAAEKMVGRHLFPKEEVHHLDCNKLNNSPNNLVVCANHSEHMKLHRQT